MSMSVTTRKRALTLDTFKTESETASVTIVLRSSKLLSLRLVTME